LKGEGFLDVPWPAKGLVESTALHRQPPGTTPDCLNVRAFDPRTGRNRGAGRSGLEKFCADRIVGEYSIQAVDHLVTTNQVPSTGIGQSTYTPSANDSFGLVNSAGTSYATGGGSGTILCSCWDSSNQLYAAVLEGSTYKVYKVSSAGAILWTSTLSATGLQAVVGMAVYEDTLLIAVSHDVGNPPESRVLRLDISDGVNEDSAGYWLDDADFEGAIEDANSNLCHNVLAVCGRVLGVLTDGSPDQLELFDLLDGSAIAQATLTGTGSTDTHMVVTDGVAFFYCLTGSHHVKKVSVTGNVEWTFNDDSNDYFGIAFDSKNQRLAVCGDLSGSNSFGLLSLTAGTLSSETSAGSVTAWHHVAYSGNGEFVLWRKNATNNQMGLTEALATDWGPSTLGGNINVQGQSANPGPNPVARADLSPRSVRLLVVSNGEVRRVTADGPVALTGGPNALDSTAPVVYGTQHFQDYYWCDGAGYRKYTSLLDQVGAWTATSGSLPVDAFSFRARLICVWRARIVLSGLQYDPQNWFMSRLGDAADWDYGATAAVATAAVAGNNSNAGKMGDVVNCLCPMDDDVLLMGGDHTIWAMVGDPADGGRLDLITDTVGMAYGRPFCMDPQGAVWFFASRGGFYRMAAGQQPERVSQAIEERLADIDVGATVASCAWDDRQQNVHLYLTPLDSTEATKHYVFDVRNKAWWVDEHANKDHNPKVVHVLDGDDPGDRVLLLGSWDGYLRMLSPDATDDDGEPIVSHVFVGPVQQKGMEGFLLKELQAVLGSESGQVTWSVHVGESVQAALSAAAAATGTFAAGRSRSQFVRRFAHAAFVRLSHSTRKANGLANAPWAYESMLAAVRPVGKVRQRAF